MMSYRANLGIWSVEIFDIRSLWFPQTASLLHLQARLALFPHLPSLRWHPALSHLGGVQGRSKEGHTLALCLMLPACELASAS